MSGAVLPARDPEELIMETAQLLAGPLVGAVIGYITNDIAVRMLFRPHKAWYVMGIHIPFTPGIIPRERGRMAKEVGRAVSGNLISQEVIEKNLLSDEMTGKLRSAIEGFIGRQRHNDETLEEFLGHYFSREEIGTAVSGVQKDIAGLVAEKLRDPAMGERIGGIAADQIIEKLRDKGEILRVIRDLLLPSGGIIGMALNGLMGEKAGAIADKVLGALREPLKELLARNITEIMDRNAEGIVGSMAESETEKLMHTSVSALLAGKEELLMKITDSLIGAYRHLVTDKLPAMLQAFNLSQVIENRINEMDMDENEKVILSVMRKELRAVVWFGAGLGMIMGCVNALFQI